MAERFVFSIHYGSKVCVKLAFVELLEKCIASRGGANFEEEAYGGGTLLPGDCSGGCLYGDSSFTGICHGCGGICRAGAKPCT